MEDDPAAVKVLWSTREWAEAVAALPAPGPLPCRTVVVPREAVAHALRRELIRAGQASALAGTRFITPLAAARHVLREAGIHCTPGEEALRPGRLLALFRAGIALEHFPLDLLRSKPGWDAAFAHTIGELEATGLRPEDVLAVTAGRGAASGVPGDPAFSEAHTGASADAPATLRDLAAVWRAVDQAAGASWSAARIYMEAAAALEWAPRIWPFFGATLAAVTGHVTAAEARFLRVIPGVTIVLLAARPIRAGYLERAGALFGREAGDALRAATAPRASATERDLLAAYLFEPPSVLADPDRPRSSGPDGSVHIEEHAGVEAEVEATADWVGRQVLDGTPLEDIAVLVPALNPLASVVAERLARLPWHDGVLPVRVAGGLPLTATAAGARALAVVTALRAHLSGDALARVLPVLRTVDGRHLSHGAAMDLAWSLGTVGGNAAHPSGALEWTARAAAREPAIAKQLEEARAAEGDPEQSRVARRARDLERLLADLRAIRPALDALVAVARLVVQGATLAVLWPALRDFLAEWLLQPGEGPRVQSLLDERLGAAAATDGCGALTGDDALRFIADAIASTRLTTGRFGDPAVYVGTVRDAIGLPFTAVRVIGLAEGHLPPLAREDPVLPDALRVRLGAAGLDGRLVHPPTAEDRALAALHALDRVVRDATARVALSSPRLDIDRSQREPSSVLLEAAAALGRPDAVTGERVRVPDTRALARDAFAPARRDALAFRRSTPLGEAAWHDGVAHGALHVPDRWRRLPALDLSRISALLSAEFAGPMDGVLGLADVPVPGLTPDRPTSPSALQRLLECPHRFLLEQLLGLDAPTAAPPRREIGQPAYGTLVHLVAEKFYAAHGEPFCAGKGTLATWLDRAGAIVERELGQFLEQYPLAGDAVRNRERERLRRDLRDLITHDWQKGGERRFVAAERTFGRPEPVELALRNRSLFVRGQIDRIEREGDVTLIRDLKTGRAHPRIGKEAETEPTLDVQIAVYALVARRLAAAWGVPARIAAAYTYVGRGVDERAYRDDFHEALEPAALEWLEVAADLLAERALPRTPDPDDCVFCPFKRVCGDGIRERAHHVLTRGSGVLPRFGALKQFEQPEED